MQIRPASPDEIEPLARLLARAFLDDPLFAWMLKSTGDRLELLRRGFAITLRYQSANLAETYLDQQRRAVAVWLPPDHRSTRLTVQLRLLPCWASLTGWRHLPRVASVVNAMERANPADRYRYLALLAVDPDHQHQGLASALLQHTLERCDREQTQAVLKTANPLSIGFYQQHGFQLTRTLTLPAGAPSIWLMTRQPSRK
jgi:ribosomal protein S18 acetylase RimI-like enzyme